MRWSLITQDTTRLSIGLKSARAEGSCWYTVVWIRDRDLVRPLYLSKFKSLKLSRAQESHGAKLQGRCWGVSALGCRPYLDIYSPLSLPLLFTCFVLGEQDIPFVVDTETPCQGRICACCRSTAAVCEDYHRCTFCSFSWKRSIQRHLRSHATFSIWSEAQAQAGEYKGWDATIEGWHIDNQPDCHYAWSPKDERRRVYCRLWRDVWTSVCETTTSTEFERRCARTIWYRCLGDGGAKMHQRRKSAQRRPPPWPRRNSMQDVGD